jgi:Cys-tRNA(Pro)/Cys-tRNA(Cys) deacylase
LARGGTPAIVALERAGVAFHVHSFEHDESAGGYGRAAAAALGVDEHRVFKTLLARVDGRPVVAIVPVTGQLALKELAAALGAKRAEMLDPADAQRLTGYVVGGISPLGQRTRLPTVADDSLLLHETVFVSGGRRGLDVELAPDDLVRLLDARTAPLSALGGGVSR